MANKKFKTEINQLLNMMINSLYSNKEIFLRELISNSSDAIDKLKYLTITEDKYKKIEFDPKITITIDEKNSTITLSDTGIGMDEDDLNKNLGTIANSGTKNFLENIEKSKSDTGMIGQFGVGFYSAFMVSKKVDVITKKAGTKEAFIWSSTGGGTYSINPTTKDEFGTDLIMTIKDEDVNEYIQSLRIESIVEKYSNHVSYPIMMMKEVTIESKDDDKSSEETVPKKEMQLTQINKAEALWMLPKGKIKEKDYIEFYKTLSIDSSDPVSWIHNKIEGNSEYTTLFYIPSNAPFDLYRVDYKTDVKLYINKVFITSGTQELMPTYLRFIKGIIDSADLPLNVSREILQNNQILQKIKDNSIKKILDHLKYLQKNDGEKYDSIYKNFGNVLKEGVYSDPAQRENILNLLIFSSLDKESITLEKYIEEMKNDQKEIYVTYGKDYQVTKNSPALDKFKKLGYNVLILTEEIDKIIFPTVFEFKEKKLIDISDAKVEGDDEIKKNDEAYEESKEFLLKIKDILKDKVNDVKVDLSLSNSCANIIVDKNDANYQTSQFMKQMGKYNDLPELKFIMNVNTENSIFKKLQKIKDDETLDTMVNIILDQAKLENGETISDPIKLSDNIKKIMDKAL